MQHILHKHTYYWVTEKFVEFGCQGFIFLWMKMQKKNAEYTTS